MIVLVERRKGFPDGKPVLGCSYSDKDGQDYISETVCKRLNLRTGVDGEAWIPFKWKDKGETMIKKFISRSEDVMKADIMFGMLDKSMATDIMLSA